MAKSLAGVVSVAAACWLLASLSAQNARQSVEEYPTPLVRERQRVVIGSVAETWELRWKSPPKSACEPSEISLTCPCVGFAYGEGGDLTLVRIVGGKEIDRLNLTPLFKGANSGLGDIAILQRWKPNDETDFKASQNDDFLGMVARRPVVKIMEFIDYDHDGHRSEFYLKTDTLPCGKSVGVVVGVSGSNHKLHVFGKASKPNEHLVLQKHIWEGLSRASGPVEVNEWYCGDHGLEEASIVRLHWTSRGIDGIRRTYACPNYPGQRPKSEGPL